MKKLAIAAVAAFVMTAPAIAAEKSSKESNVFVEKARKVIKGDEYITAVREDGRQTALVTISRSGKVSGTVEGKSVKVAFRD